jgi:NitT/TauT family transport system permease protein/taurine transport system permease protein
MQNAKVELDQPPLASRRGVRRPLSWRIVDLAVDLAWLVGPFIVLLAIWAIVIQVWNVPSRIFPSISDVLNKAREIVESGQGLRDLGASLGRISIGVALAIATGVPFGLMMGTSKPVSDFFTPLLRFSVGISGIAWIPIATLWLGYGPLVCIFIIWNSVFFAIVYNTMLGVRSMNKDLARAARTFGTSTPRIYAEVLLPGALPAILNGLRSGLGYGWRGLVAAEIIATNVGLGYSLFLAQKNYDTAEIVLIMIILGSLWLALDRLVFAPLEQRTVRRWGLVRRASP